MRKTISRFNYGGFNRTTFNALAVNLVRSIHVWCCFDWQEVLLPWLDDRLNVE